MLNLYNFLFRLLAGYQLTQVNPKMPVKTAIDQGCGVPRSPSPLEFGFWPFEGD